MQVNLWLGFQRLFYMLKFIWRWKIGLGSMEMIEILKLLYDVPQSHNLKYFIHKNSKNL